eukprot:CAMPEP_0170279590 /NCGR_PEP_ID=MMETSP0116_2-20130129/39806_1 /TAXON_ID=400756 /ORGANISM="Durinskia baltica, Strain CSIRO CS-38" /LENGTH=60 /DNA_ID=CAMNT_0010530915 /DNA_START=71 /DNA_END=253 /DNA_ORIENTATION=-
MAAETMVLWKIVGLYPRRQRRPTSTAGDHVAMTSSERTGASSRGMTIAHTKSQAREWRTV